MYLFDRTGDTIEIYSMKPNISQIKEFQKKEIKKIPEEHRVLQISSNAKTLPFEKKFTFESKNRPIDVENNQLTFCNKKMFGSEFHRLQTPKTGDLQSEFVKEKLNAYYAGNYNNSQIIRVFKYDDDQKRLNFILFLLLNNYYVKENKYSNIQVIKDIINIPESLYLLELLKRGQYSLLDNKDITEQLELFNISEDPIKTYSLYELEELGQYGFDPYAVPKALRNVEESKVIFERIRRKK